MTGDLRIHVRMQKNLERVVPHMMRLQCAAGQTPTARNRASRSGRWCLHSLFRDGVSRGSALGQPFMKEIGIATQTATALSRFMAGENCITCATRSPA